MKKTLIISILVLTMGICGTAMAQHQSHRITLDSTYNLRDTTCQLKRYYDSIQKVYNAYFGKYVAEATCNLTNDKPQGTLDNLLTDALLQIGDSLSLAYDGRHTDLSLLNFGGVRTGLNQGKIFLSDIYRVLPFESNVIVLLDIKGSELRKVIFENLRELANVQAFANVKLVYSNNAIVSATVDGQPIDDSRTYRIATINFIETGGDKILENAATTHVLSDDASFRSRITDYIRQKRTISAQFDDRVTVK